MNEQIADTYEALEAARAELAKSLKRLDMLEKKVARKETAVAVYAKRRQ